MCLRTRVRLPPPPPDFARRWRASSRLASEPVSRSLSRRSGASREGGLLSSFRAAAGRPCPAIRFGHSWRQPGSEPATRQATGVGDLALLSSDAAPATADSRGYFWGLRADARALLRRHVDRGTQRRRVRLEFTGDASACGRDDVKARADVDRGERAADARLVPRLHQPISIRGARRPLRPCLAWPSRSGMRRRA